MRALSLVTLLLLSASSMADTAPAPIIKTPEPKAPIPSILKIEATGTKLDNIDVKALGTAIRNKRMVFNFGVYKATLYGSDAAAFVRDNQGVVALKSLAGM